MDERIVAAVATVRQRLWAMQDVAYGDFTASLMPTVPRETVIGVRTPDLRRYAKELLRSQREVALSFVQDLPHGYFEENQLHAFLLEGLSAFLSWCFLRGSNPGPQH